MIVTTTRIRALTFTVLIEEATSAAPDGQSLFYLASVYKLTDDGSKQLLRRSRLPGAALTLKIELQRDGLRAFDRL
ncbi:hypothetical protein [Rhizobium sp. GR12]|uniref:hypothetical protein n=1 Tax=Rhizobium sp. GR12 TaxID=3053925 RepID=UPI002FBE2068